MDTNNADRRRERRDLRRQGRSQFVNVGRNERVVSALLGGALAAYGLKRRGPRGLSLAAMGAELIYRGLSGHCMAYGALGMNTSKEPALGETAEVDSTKSIDVRRSIEIDRPREELFAIWRDFSRLPQFMAHLERVDVLSSTKSHWVTKGPIGTTVEWDAEIVDERENEWIAWQSIEPAQVPNNGTVMFRESPGGGTEIFVTLEAEPPAGKLGDLVARMFGRSPDRQVRMALEKFKEMVESNHDFGASASSDRSADLSSNRGSSFGDREVPLGGRQELTDDRERESSGTGAGTDSFTTGDDDGTRSESRF
jgi:uncharacterized membrane protein